jgi:excisionase family DNA binding protein
MKRELEFDSLLTPSEVASMFAVDPTTVTRWAKAGKLTSVRTPGGHRRYREAEVRGLLTVGERGGPAAETACLDVPVEQAA